MSRWLCTWERHRPLVTPPSWRPNCSCSTPPTASHKLTHRLPSSPKWLRMSGPAIKHCKHSSQTCMSHFSRQPRRRARSSLSAKRCASSCWKPISRRSKNGTKPSQKISRIARPALTLLHQLAREASSQLLTRAPRCSLAFARQACFRPRHLHPRIASLSAAQRARRNVVTQEPSPRTS